MTKKFRLGNTTLLVPFLSHGTVAVTRKPVQSSQKSLVFVCPFQLPGMACKRSKRALFPSSPHTRNQVLKSKLRVVCDTRYCFKKSSHSGRNFFLSPYLMASNVHFLIEHTVWQNYGPPPFSPWVNVEYCGAYLFKRHFNIDSWGKGGFSGLDSFTFVKQCVVFFRVQNR